MRTIQESFGPNAAKYGQSAIHNNPDEFTYLIGLTNLQPTDRLLDVATGAGNTALAFAPHCREVVAFDATQPMLDEVTKRAESDGITNLTTCLGYAEDLPFQPEEFDIVTNRLACHHFTDLAKAVQETHRVLKPGGKFLVVDNFSSEDDTLAMQLDEIERLRDPSHHWSLKLSQWKQLLIESGFEIVVLEENDWKAIRMNFREWMDRIGTPAANRPRLEEVFHQFDQPLAQFLLIRQDEKDISFRLPTFTLLAVKR